MYKINLFYHYTEENISKLQNIENAYEVGILKCRNCDQTPSCLPAY